MPLRARLAAWLLRSSENAPETVSAAQAPAPSTGGGNGGVGSTLPPWGNQWPVYGGRHRAENLSVVCACVQAIAGTIGSLPVGVFQRTRDGKRIERPDHPVARLVRQGPNNLQSWADFCEWLLASALLQGNAIAVIDHDGAGRPTGLYPIPWWACQPLLVPASGATAIGSPVMPNSRLCFDVVMTMQPWPLLVRPTGFPVRYFADEVLFLRDRSDDSILGRPRLSRCPEVLSAALGAQGFSANVWTNGAMVGGVLQHPGRLSKESGDRIAQSWRDTHAGPGNAGRMVVLEEGMSYEKIGVSPEDAELLDSRRFSVEELARVFDVPPPIIGDWSKATFSNTASAREWFAALTLLPWVNKIEKEFSRTVINDPDISLCIDMSGMLRGDFPQLVNSYVQLVRSGIASPDEARHAVGLDPRGGEADELTMQATGGRPPGTEDGAGDSPPAINGSGRGANGAAL